MWNWKTYVAGMILAGLLPVGARALRQQDQARCELDGTAIETTFRVRVIDAAGESHGFCCVPCAEEWLLHRRGDTQAVMVTDEASGREIDASLARFVRSSVPAGRAGQNRIHVFWHRADALRHAKQAGGRPLLGRDRPFSNLGGASPNSR